jgi:hypothetical protein
MKVLGGLHNDAHRLFGGRVFTGKSLQTIPRQACSAVLGDFLFIEGEVDDTHHQR